MVKPVNCWILTSSSPQLTTGGAEIFWLQLSKNLPFSFDFVTGDRGPELVRILQCYKKVFTRLHDEQPRFVLSSGASGSLWPIDSIPRINVYHGTYDGYRRSFRNPLKTNLHINILKALERRSGNGCIKVAVSNQVAYELREYYHFSSKEIVVIENGVDTTRFRPSSHLEKVLLRKKYGLPLDKKIVTFVGPLTYSKGLDVLQLLLRTLDDIFLLVLTATKQPLLSSFKNCFVIKVPYNQIHEFYMLSDLFVSPSRYEAFSLSLLEAMACGLPFVSFRTGWLRDFKNDYSMAIANDPDQFVSKTLDLLNDAPLRNSLSERVRLLAELHDWALISKKYHALINKLLE